MHIKLQSWQKAVLLTIASLFLLATLVKPLLLSLYTYFTYKKVNSQQTYTNATINTVKKKTAVLAIFGRCYIEVTYDFTANGQPYHNHDNINCGDQNKVAVGNTVPVYYDPANPKKSASDFALATNTKQLEDNIIPGVIGTLLIASLIILTLLPHRSKDEHLTDY